MLLLRLNNAISRKRFSVRDRKSFSLSLLAHSEHDAEVTVVVAGTADAEMSYLASALNVGTEARTHVVVAHIDQAQCFAGIFGQLA